VAKEITLTAGGVSAVAQLLEAEAPITTQRLWDALPLDEPFRHVRRGGSAGYIHSTKMRDDPTRLPIENRVSFYVPGTINLKPHQGEICVSYGQAQARTVTGNEYATQLAKLVGDYGPFLEVVRKMQTHGMQRLVIARKE
jgi:hypothetical protein